MPEHVQAGNLSGDESSGGGNPEDWLKDAIRFAAQVMTYGDWTDTCTALKLLGDPLFRQVLENAPPGVFDLKS